jgi:hypothetical protein
MHTGWVAYHFPGKVEQLKHFWHNHPVKDVPSVSPVLDDADFSQYRELLREISLPESQHSFHVADTVLSFPQNIQDSKPGRMGEGF